jgi:molybdate transport system permease protein
MTTFSTENPAASKPALNADWPFYLCLALLGGSYLVLIVAMLAADLFFTTPDHLLGALQSPEIKYAIKLSLISCSITAILSLWVAVPLAYLLARTQFPGKLLVDTLLDIPIVLPPLVIGLSLLILFQTRIGKFFEEHFLTVTYAVPSNEQVAMTLGCTRSQAFWFITIPEARRGLMTAFTLSWARSLGEFGPILIFSGATRLRTEVLPTTVFLELSVGKIEAAIAVSLLMIAVAVIVLILTRTLGLRGTGLV